MNHRTAQLLIASALSSLPVSRALAVTCSRDDSPHVDDFQKDAAAVVKKYPVPLPKSAILEVAVAGQLTPFEGDSVAALTRRNAKTWFFVFAPDGKGGFRKLVEREIEIDPGPQGGLNGVLRFAKGLLLVDFESMGTGASSWSIFKLRWQKGALAVIGYTAGGFMVDKDGSCVPDTSVDVNFPARKRLDGSKPCSTVDALPGLEAVSESYEPPGCGPESKRRRK